MTLAVALVLVPFAAACLGLAVGRVRPRLVAPVAVGAAAASTLLALGLAISVLTGAAVDGTLATVTTGGIPVRLAFLADGLSVVVAVVVAVVALLVQVFSTGYLHGDPRYSSYAALVSLFTAAMLLVVLAGDLMVLFVGWEVMGICSYFLIGHHWEQHQARAAAVKAFLVTRIGDVLLLFGIFALGTAAGSFRIEDAVARTGTSTVVLLLVLGGALGKSAQFPLHVWLPDAMAGPTPISALIHAATMVAAGVFLVARLWPLYATDGTVLAILAVGSVVTMVGAALAALAQEDLKRVLAWSTVSQLAYMFAALSVRAPEAAIFHLVSHAAFKALLFLAAGSVMHAVGTSLMADMGGLRRAMPVTTATMAVGLAALAGIPPLSGFFSKESVLAAAEEQALHGEARWVGWLVLVAGLLTVVLTAAYATRLLLRAFLGERRGTVALTESPASMRWPLVVLAGATVALGVLALPDLLPRWLAPTGGWFAYTPLSRSVFSVGGTVTAGGPSLAPAVSTVALSLVALALGAGGCWLVWRRHPDRDPAEELRAARPVLAGAFGVDVAYDRLVVRPVRALGTLVLALDRDVVHGYVRGAGTGAALAGIAVRATQRGNVQRYLTVLLTGAVLLAVAGAVAR